jgi:hypothetical protein
VTPVEAAAEQTEWAQVADATAALGLAPRSVYRWVKAGTLPSRKQGGVLLIDMAALRGLAMSRQRAGTVPGIAGNVANGKVAGRGVVEADGDLAARLFEAFERGEAPADLVRSERIPPALALATWKQFRDLREAGGGGRPTFGDRLAALSAEVAAFGAVFAEFKSVVEGEFAHLAGRVRAVECQKAELPLPPNRTDFACQCGARGFFVVPLRCSCCGREQQSGFHPGKE